jgi:hypothetical protein
MYKLNRMLVMFNTKSVTMLLQHQLFFIQFYVRGYYEKGWLYRLNGSTSR